MAIKVSWTKALSCVDKETPCKTRLRITAVNKGNTPAQIAGMGIRYPRRSGLPSQIIMPIAQVLGPSEEASVYFTIEDFKGFYRYDAIFAQDSAGKMYYPDTSLFKKIDRFLWWHFGSAPYNEKPR